MKLFKYLLLLLLSFLVATESVLAGYKIGPVDIHRLIELMIFIYLLNIFMKDYNQNNLLKVYFFTVLIFIGLLLLKLTTLILFKNGVDTEVFIDIVRLVLMFLYTYLIFYLIRNNYKWLNYVLFFNFIIFLIGLFQFNLFSFNEIFWNIKIDFFNRNTPNDMQDFTDRSRIVGLYPFAIPFAYALINNLIITIYMYLKTNKNIYIYYFMFLGIVGILSLTRSFILSFAIMILYLIYILIFKGSVLKKIITFTVSIIVLLGLINFYQEKTESVSRLTDTKDGSFNSRIPLAVMGATIVYEHPFGAAEKEVDKIKREIAHEFNNPYVLKYPSHVGIFEIMRKYTILSLPLFIFFFYYLYRKCIKYLEPKLKYFFIFSFFAYMINTLFHNMIIFGEDYYILTVIAIILYEYEEVKKRRLIEKN